MDDFNRDRTINSVPTATSTPKYIFSGNSIPIA